ncbi:hypothetical protein BCU68_04675 [Vibrio sp. 10N.286.49.B3]|uniref:hypothetical protein n=1 Tax=Vibrio sp. 10N.286.49.B3 TaxID=1880855 RepID=UPI000C85E295|nr:hypothetical protein [Vibrio sp. 10N.286.49.B3]PMH40977.1 hypothetical protein BCU68_04675 [Vibrio sp. 10N.286.49.B3]
MNVVKSLFIASTVLTAVGCSTLDSSSDFSDAVQSIKERSNYVEVKAKPITPMMKARVGADLVRSELSYVAMQAKNETQLSKSSHIDMSVSFFKSYDLFHSVIIHGETVKIQSLRPTSETCTEHCTVTQWFTFPFSASSLDQFQGSNVQLLLTSGKKNIIEVEVPKAYFSAIENEASSLVAKNDTVKQQGYGFIHNSVDSTLDATKNIEMTQYWYNQSSVQEKEQFTQYVFDNRKGVTSDLTSDSQALTMMSYWYLEASADERTAILQWLIKQ